MIVIVAEYVGVHLDVLRQSARELINRLNAKQLKLEIVCSFKRATSTFHVSIRLFF